MAILTDQALHSIERGLAHFKECPKSQPHGYPAALITDLLDTIRDTKRLKKKYQRLADLRGKCIMEIFSITSRAVDKTTEALEE